MVGTSWQPGRVRCTIGPMSHLPVTADGEGGPVPRSITGRDTTMDPPREGDVALVAELLDVPEDDERPREVVAGWSAHWEEHGYGTWVVRDEDGSAVGFVGLQDQGDFIRLTTRFVAGVAQERAVHSLRLATAHAVEWLPDLPVRMRVAPDDTRTRELLTAAGLVHVPELDHTADGESWQVLELPYVRQVDRIPPRAREAVIDMWITVNDSGGSVGFRPGAGRVEVGETLDGYAERMASGSVVGAALNSPTGDLLGFGCLVLGAGDLQAHTANLERVMIDPERRHTNRGRLLLAGLNRAARERGVEMVTLDYRGGTGLEEFYTRFGYTEVGRVPGALRVADGDDRDRVIMARTL